MKKYFPIYLYGLLIIREGVFLLFAEYNDFNFIHLTTGIMLTIGAIIAFVAAFSQKRKQVQFAYHEMHVLAMLVYGISIFLFCNNLETFISYTAFLFIFYMFSEIILCNWIFNLGQKMVYKIVIIRVLLGLVVGIGTIVVMNLQTFKLEGFGILFILVGVNLVLYIPVMKVSLITEIY